MAKVELDAHWFPLIVQRWPAVLTEPDLQGFFQALDEVARRALRSSTYYVVVVVGPLATLDAGQRRRVAKSVRDMPRELRERNVGTFIIVGSSMQRGVIAALRWVVPELRDVTAVDSVELAVKQALATLEAKAVPAPGSDAEIIRYIVERGTGWPPPGSQFPPRGQRLI